MKFPFKDKPLTINSSEITFLQDYSNHAELPVLPHPGAFSKVRKNHIHEGIDLYCNKHEAVYAMEIGKIVNINYFTGKEIDSPWWNTTWCVMVEGESGVINYGEIIPDKNIKIGDVVQEGQLIGKVVPVLKKYKGRPMNMLHLELYKQGTKEHLKEWSLSMDKPDNLLDPTILLTPFLSLKKSPKI